MLNIDNGIIIVGIPEPVIEKINNIDIKEEVETPEFTKESLEILGVKEIGKSYKLGDSVFTEFKYEDGEYIAYKDNNTLYLSVEFV